MKPYVTVGGALTYPSVEIGEEHDEIPNHYVPNIRDRTIERIESTDQGEPLYESYKQNQRLNADEPSPTIINESWKYAHPTEPRPISVRERACLQSFPDDFEFYGGVTEQRQSVANAVPPLLAEAIANELLNDEK